MPSVPQQSGLKPIDHDRSQDWSHEKIFGASTALPRTLNRAKLPVEDQQDTNFCTAYGTSKANAYRRGYDFSPEYQVAMIGEYVGRPIMDGTDPKSAMNAAVLNGSLIKSLASFSLARQGAAYIAEYLNWPASLMKTSEEEAPAGWFSVADDPATDVFDDIRNALEVAKSDNGVIMGFGFWYNEFNTAANDHSKNGMMPVPTMQPSSRHCYLYIDFDTIDGVDVIVAQLSQGVQYGVNGYCYFPRETINKIWEDMVGNGTGMYIFRSYGGRASSLIQIGYALLAQAKDLLKQLLP